MINIIFTISSWIALMVVLLSLILTIWRLREGPQLMDRVLSLDLLVTLGIALICIVSTITGSFLYIDIAIALALVGFLGTVAFAFFALRRRQLDDNQDNIEVD